MNTTRISVLMGTLLVAALMGSGCATGRLTTTTRTAVEQALLSEAAEKTLAKFEDSDAPAGRTFHLDDSQFESVDQKFALSATRLHFLAKGMREVGKDEADVHVRARSAIAGIDDSSFLIGVPSFPILVPGAGSITTPELALFKREHQIAHNKLGLYGVNREDGSLAFDYGTESSSAFYTRWRILLVIGFRTTDLSEPYRAAAKNEE